MLSMFSRVVLRPQLKDLADSDDKDSFDDEEEEEQDDGGSPLFSQLKDSADRNSFPVGNPVLMNPGKRQQTTALCLQPTRS